MGIDHPNARLGIPVCGIAARDESEVAATPRADHGDLHSPPSLAQSLPAWPVPTGFFEPCLKHGQFRIIVPIDEINDQH
jgi:hypothetical protein